MFRVEAIRIGESQPAPLLSPIVGPSESGRAVAETRQELKQRHRSRFEFWQMLLSVSRDKTKLFSGISPGMHPYISTGAGMAGLSYQYWLRQHDVFVVLWIDRGKENAVQNEVLFEQLLAHRAEIEAAFGGPLNWDRLDGSRACKVVGPSLAGGWKDEPEIWPEVIDRIIEVMIRFNVALAPHVGALSVS